MTDESMRDLLAKLLGKDGPKPESLIELAPALPESLLPRAIEIALAIPNLSDRVDVLLALAARLPVATREVLLRKMLESVREKIYPWKYAAALRDAATLVSEEERPIALAEALEAARKIPSGYEDFQAKELTRFVPLLPEAQRRTVLTEALDAAHGIDDFWRQSDTLAEMAGLLPEPERKDILERALDAARKIQNEHNRARALIDLLKELTEPQIDEALELVLEINNEEYRAPALAGLAPYLSEDELNRAISSANAIKTPEYRTQAMAGLAYYAPQPLKRDTLHQAWDVARRIGTLKQRNQVLMAIKCQIDTLDEFRDMSPMMPPADWIRSTKEERASRALFTALTIDDGYWRALALGALAQQLPERLKGKALYEAHASTSRPSDNEVKGEAARSWLLRLPRSPEPLERRASPTGLPGDSTVPPHSPGKPLKKMPQLPEWAGPLSDQTFKVEESEEKALMKEVLDEMQTRVVNTAFAPRSQPTKPLEKSMPLQAGQPYYFCLDIGEPKLNLMEGISTSLPQGLPPKARLKIVLFGFKDEIKINPGADVGELEMQPDGFASVLHQPDQQLNIPSDPSLQKKCLFFPIESPGEEGTFRLRCNIYYENILLQSRLIHALVMSRPQPTASSLSFDIEYALSNSLWPAHLTRMQPHRLSLMLTGNDDGSHTLFFVGEKDGKEPFNSDAVISSTELKSTIENARKAMRKTSWGNEGPWNGTEYLYEKKPYDPARFKSDLIGLAIRGYNLYDAIIDKLTGGPKRSDELADLMRESGLVQIALRKSPAQILPAALFYDYPLDTNPGHPLRICDAFIEAQKKDVPLEDTPCFQGACPRYGQVDYVCPSGFWGYRHSLGLPVSADTDAPPEIILKGEPQIVVGVATNLAQLDTHMVNLKDILGKTQSGNGWYYSDNRETILKDFLKTKKPHLIYFYCHGGLDHDMPYLQVGGGNEYIDKSNLRTYGIYWDSPQPLVFINGCHTTAVDPEQAANLVEGFVGRGGAGVIGTEITIFEPLACSFAEECLRQFLVKKISIGEAVRKARLKLLKEGNPLGLVYTPFVLPSLHLLELPDDS